MTQPTPEPTPAPTPTPAPAIAPVDPAAVAWGPDGLAPAVVQDARTGEVLTLAWMNRESLARTLETGQTWFWSRSRAELWHKGATSGNTQRVTGVSADCDRDALVVQVEPAGPACHTGARTCFHAPLRGVEPVTSAEDHPVIRGTWDLGEAIDGLARTIARRKAELPQGSYTTYLFQAGLDKVLKKVGEEATEVVIAAKNPDDDALVGELADLVYHLLVLMAERGVTPEQLALRLRQRRRPDPEPTQPA